MANAPRTRLDPDARRAQLVELGLRQLDTRPLDRVTVDEVAAAAGISRALVFHYFATKRDLHVAVAEAAAAELLARTSPDPALAPIDRLRAGVSAYVDHVADRRDAYVAFIRGASGGEPQIMAVYDRTRTALTERILDGLGETAPTPRLRVTVRGWVGFVEEVTVGWLGQPDLTRDELVDLLDDALVALVVSTTGGWPEAPA